MFLNSNTLLSMYLFCNSRIHVITLYLGHVCVYYVSMLWCWHLIWILVRTDHTCLGVGCHNRPKEFQIHSWSKEIKDEVKNTLRRGKLVGESKTPVLGELDQPQSSKITRRNQEITNGGLGATLTVVL
jgi:hypothetical protein